MGCPKLPHRSQPLVGRSSPYCENTWNKYCCLTSFLLIVDTCLSCENTVGQNCAIVRRWRIFGDILHPVLSASCMQHISNLHSKFALRPHHVWKYGRHPVCLQQLRIGEEKKKELECGPMPNVMVALPNTAGALCSTPQSLADAHY